MRVKGGKWAGAAEGSAGKAAGFMKSCGFYIGDVPGQRVNQRRRDQLSVNRRRLRNKYAHECRV